MKDMLCGVSALFCVLFFSAGAFAAEPYHYLCHFSLGAKDATLLEIRKVDSPLQKRRVQKTGQPFRFLLLDAKGTALHSGDFADPRRVTAEFANPDGSQEHARAVKTEGSLLLALPPFEAGAKLTFMHRTSRGTKGKGKGKVRYLPFATVELPAPPSTAEAAKVPQPATK